MKYMKYVLLFLVLAGVVFSSFSYSSAVDRWDGYRNLEGYIVGEPTTFRCTPCTHSSCWFPGIAPGQPM